MGFSVFDHGISPSVDQTLADPYFQQLLFSLLTEHLFLTAGQARQYLLQAAPPDTSPELVREDYVRKILDRLVRAGYLVAATALLPPVTIGVEPVAILRSHFAVAPTPEEIRPYARPAFERVPGLDLHKPRRLYCAAEPLRPVLRGFGHTVPEWIANRFWPTREAVFQIVYDAHLEVLARPGHSAHEIACTQLTAYYNVNHLRFTERFRAAVAGGQRGYAVNVHLTTRDPDARLDDAEFGRIAVYFARPVPAQALSAQMEACRGTHLFTGPFRTALWL